MKRLVNLMPWRLRRALRALRVPALEELSDVPDLFLCYRKLNAHPDLRRKPGGWVYQGRFYPDYLTVGGAGPAIFKTALQWCQGTGIDVGAGLWGLPGATPCDVWRGAGFGRSLDDMPSESLDYVFSSHCLEHVELWQDTLAGWIRPLKSGGVVFLYLPHPDCAIWHPGSPFVGDGHKWIPTPAVIEAALVKLGLEIIGSDRGPDAMQSFYVCARRKEG